MSDILDPRIASQGYMVSTITQFLALAPWSLIDRFGKYCLNFDGDLVLWDLDDGNAEGLLIRASTIAEINDAFAEYQ